MKKIALFLLSIFILLLTSCSGMRKPDPHCAVNCIQRFQACTKICRNNCHHCTAFAKQSAANSYRQYIREQVITGQRFTRSLYSYRDPLQCRKTTCNCPLDYQVCIQACGGVIQKRLKVPTVC